MNFSSFIGLIIGILVIGLAATSSGVPYSVLWNPTGALIVIGGTIGATLMAVDIHEFGRAWRSLWVIFSHDRDQSRGDAEDIIHVTKAWVSHDVRKVDEAIARVKSPILRLGAQLVTDGNMPLNGIIETLERRIDKIRSKERSEAQIFSAMASYSPAFGMLGTLFGLITMLRTTSESQDLSAITSGLAVALITTLYGIVLANVLFRPLATKLEHRTEVRLKRLYMILEAICLMKQTRSLSVVQEYEESVNAEFGNAPISDSQEKIPEGLR